MKILELYRISEFENIQKEFKFFFGVDFEIDTKILVSLINRLKAVY